MKTLEILTAALFCAAAFAGTAPAKPAAGRTASGHCKVRLVQWNIHIGIDMTFRWNLKAQADVLNRIGGDVVVLNEVDKNCRRTGYTDMTGALALLTGNMFHQFGAARALPPEGLYGNAVLSRWPMELVGAWPIPSPAYESRSMTLVKIAAPAPFYVAFTHLNHRKAPEENLIRVAAVRKIDELISQNCKDGLPAVIAGDFNCVPGSDPVKALEEAGWTLGTPLLTFPSKKPRVSIDHVFFREGMVKLENRFTVDEKNASDHVPVVNELVIFRSTPQKKGKK